MENVSRLTAKEALQPLYTPREKDFINILYLINSLLT